MILTALLTGLGVAFVGCVGIARAGGDEAHNKDALAMLFLASICFGTAWAVN